MSVPVLANNVGERSLTGGPTPVDVSPVEVTVLMPCLNEAETLASCIKKAHASCRGLGVNYEVIVADNGSTDGSRAIAMAFGARVIDVPVRGYGAALRAGIQAALGKYVIMADADDSYDLRELAPFIEKLRAGYQLVMGTRLRGEIKNGAMPFLHRAIGNPVLTGIGNLFFHCGLSDYHCGLRAFDREAILGLNLRSPGMEFASEMVIKAALADLSTAEVPIVYWPDGRSRRPHLRTWRDGWRHLRFMLLYSPRWLFFYPGLALTLLGLLGMAALLPGPINIGATIVDVHSLLVAAFAVLVGTQLVFTAIFLRLFVSRIGLLPVNPSLYRVSLRFTLELGIAVGLAMLIAGLLVNGWALWLWGQADFGPLNYEYTLRIVIAGSTLLGLGFEVCFSSFMVSLLDLIDSRTEQTRLEAKA